jgi:hypothetical protein
MLNFKINKGRDIENVIPPHCSQNKAVTYYLHYCGHIICQILFSQIFNEIRIFQGAELKIMDNHKIISLHTILQ